MITSFGPDWDQLCSTAYRRLPSRGSRGSPGGCNSHQVASFCNDSEQLAGSVPAVQADAIQRTIQLWECMAVAAANGLLPSSCLRQTTLDCAVNVLKK